MSPLYPPASTVDLTGVETAAQQGFIAQTMQRDPATSLILAKGVLTLTKIWLPKTVTVSNIYIYISTAGATLATCFATLYDSTGAKITGMDTADQSTPWQTGGLKTMAVTTPGAVTGGAGVFVWAGLLPGNASTTAPTILRRAGVDSTEVNANLTAATFNVATTGSALTALPASFTPSGLTNGNSGQFWAAIS